jgi:hypothetical protein
MVEIKVDPKDAAELNEWYETEHLREMLAIDGVLSASRYVDVGGDGRYLVIYELECADILSSPAYRQRIRSNWTDRLSKRWLSMDRSVWEAL